MNLIYKSKYKPLPLLIILTLLYTFTIAGCNSPITEESPTPKNNTTTESISAGMNRTLNQASPSSDDKTGSNLTVTFLDVGQGNSILAECDGQYMLIDGGDRDYSSFVVSYLKKHGITTLDYLIVSHYDSDHLSGTIGVLHNFSIGTVLSPDYKGDTKIYNSYIEALADAGETPVHPEVGDNYSFGSAEFTIVCPKHYQYAEENDNSVGIRLINGSNEFLLLGDASEESEQDMLDSAIELESDVYMVSHHGSSHSSSEKFIDEVNPKYAIISVGNDNSYGHPHEEVLTALQENEIPVLRTDRDGTIIAVSDGENITFNASPELIENVRTESGDTQNSNNSSIGTENKDTSAHINTENNTDSANKEIMAVRDSEYTYIANKNTHKFHDNTCSGLPEEKNRIYYTSREEAVSDGYEPCKRCKP